MYISEKTKKIRHSIVRLIAPTIYYEAVPQLPRPMITFLSKRKEHNSMIGLEIGVSTGDHARSILESLHMSKLFLIDPYTLSDVSLKAKKNLYNYRDKIHFIQKRSSDAVRNVPNNLDFVYIDGCHDYEVVKSDIENYYPKIKSGGVIGGHDFCALLLGVCEASIEFSLKNKLKLYAERLDWWMIKEE